MLKMSIETKFKAEPMMVFGLPEEEKPYFYIRLHVLYPSFSSCILLKDFRTFSSVHDVGGCNSPLPW
jgi:hypothetical protein